ncbi:hypothetical protein [Absidia glauca]|uniref:Uncharacterized protein n=1 Tax=Absidia glauca TaxID=4829 RepID=A0A170AP97_ABSGL|nr:hypothetical protein [Absidia glauca]
MLYAPSPYSSSGTEASTYEQDTYSTGTPPSPPTGHGLPNAHHKESSEPNDNSDNDVDDPTDLRHESPPPTPKHIMFLQDDQDEQHTTTLGDTEEDDFFFLGQLQNNTVGLEDRQLQQHQHQQPPPLQNGDYGLVYDNEFQDSGDVYQQQELEQRHLQQQQGYHSDQGVYTFEPFDTSMYSTPSVTDDDFETANRAFHATINKFSRQNYPEYRKRAPYNFLENWHLHSMYSKSQQILLGIPHVRPMVLLSGDDFMFTPPLLQQEEDDDYLGDNDQLVYLDQSMQMEWIDDGQMFEDGNDILDDGIVIMSAPDPPPLMDLAILSPNTPSAPPTCTVLNENAWMKNQTDFMHDHYQLDDSTNDIDEDQQQQGQASFSLTPSSDNEEPLYFARGLSSELLHWYRTADRGRPPSTIMESIDGEDDHIVVRMELSNTSIDGPRSEHGKGSTDIDGNTDNEQSGTVPASADHPSTNQIDPPTFDHHTSPTSYQSLADIVTLPSSTSSMHLDPAHYGSTYEHEHPTTTPSFSQSRWNNQPHLGVSDQLVATSELVLTLASEYRMDGKGTSFFFLACLLRIWQVWLLTAELLLAGLWGPPSASKRTHRSSSVKPLLPI